MKTIELTHWVVTNARGNIRVVKIGNEKPADTVLGRPLTKEGAESEARKLRNHLA